MPLENLNRRDLLRLTAAAGATLAAGPLAGALETNPRILDAHIHLYDPRRPDGIPWPLPADSIYAPALPDRYAKIATPFGVRGAIAVEASPRFEDNDWVLETAAANPIIVGFIGNLIPGSPEYNRQLDRLRTNPLFLGFRYGNLWDRNLATDSLKPAFMDGLKHLASTGLVFESANPTPELIAALLRIGEAIPELRIVLDHLPSLQLPADITPRTDYLNHLQQLATNPKVFVKLSEIPVQIEGKTRLDLAYYKDHLDQIWSTFGEDRIFFGSDWPNSDHLASYAGTLKLVRSYIETKPAIAHQKFFWSNSIRAYQWKPRRPGQAHT
ncbi:amidohydrolase family protein [Silvibacterium acidisoli]|uniref:amidohydrolase family protein n=1 Tax=Acidobacteriaceae bacterium ZG23-2 TaxID=2883246 RepID=UPI00406C3465